jgi:hypothetical protein
MTTLLFGRISLAMSYPLKTWLSGVLARVCLSVLRNAYTDLAKGSGQVLAVLKRAQHPHLFRFYSHLEKLPIPQQVLDSVNTAKQKKVTAFPLVLFHIDAKVGPNRQGDQHRVHS